MAYPNVVKKSGAVKTLLSSGDTMRELRNLESAKASKLCEQAEKLRSVILILESLVFSSGRRRFGNDH